MKLLQTNPKFRFRTFTIDEGHVLKPSMKLSSIDYCLIRLGKLPINDFVIEFLMKFDSDQTKTAYRKDLALFSVFIDERVIQSSWNIFDLNANHLEKFKDALINDGLSPSTVNRRLGTLKSFMNWAMDLRYIPKMRLSGVKLPKVAYKKEGEEFSKEEIALLLNSPDMTDHKGRTHYLVMYMILQLGLNRSEITLLKLSDFSSIGSDFYLSVQGRNSTFRKIPLATDVVRRINEYLASFTKPLREDDYLIQTESHQRNVLPMDGSTIYRIIGRYSNVLGIKKKVSPRTFRKSAIKKMTKDNSVEYVASFVGHSNTQTTSTYLP